MCLGNCPNSTSGENAILINSSIESEADKNLENSDLLFSWSG
jgi:hypothetical protein